MIENQGKREEMTLFLLFLVFLLVIVGYVGYQYISGFYGWKNRDGNQLKSHDLNMLFRCNLISIVGPSCSGKTSLAMKMKERYNKLQIIDMDNLFWEPNWIMVNDHEFLKRLENKINECKLNNKPIILVGNYRIANYYTWIKSDLVIILYIPFWVAFMHCLKRTLMGLLFKTKICNGNSETISNLLSKQSIIKRVWTLHNIKLQQITQKYQLNNKSKQIIKLTSPYYIQSFLNKLVIPS